MDNAIITISSKLPQEEEPFELISQGFYQKEGEDFSLTYAESSLTGMEDTKTTVRSQGQELAIIRHGGFNSTLEFAQGEVRHCLYQTPYGTLNVKTETKDLVWQAQADGLKLKLTYLLTIEGEVQGETDLTIDANLRNLPS